VEYSVKFTCDGGDSSPPLQIAEIPSGAKSLALVVDDPDAPSGLFTHWIVWNISPQTNAIAEGSAPKGVQEQMTSAKRVTEDRVHLWYASLLLQDFALDRELDCHPARNGVIWMQR